MPSFGQGFREPDAQRRGVHPSGIDPAHAAKALQSCITFPDGHLGRTRASVGYHGPTMPVDDGARLRKAPRQHGIDRPGQHLRRGRCLTAQRYGPPHHQPVQTGRRDGARTAVHRRDPFLCRARYFAPAPVAAPRAEIFNPTPYPLEPASSCSARRGRGWHGRGCGPLVCARSPMRLRVSRNGI